MARKIAVQIVGDDSSLLASFRRSSAAAGAFNRDLGRAGRGVAAVSLGYRSLARSVAFASTAFVGTAGLTLAIKDSIAGFTTFNEAMQRSVGLAGVAQKSVAGFSQQILELAPKVGKSPQELANAFYFVASSGIAASKAMSVVTAAAKASAAGLGETQVVADAVTSAMNAYGPSVLSAQKATDVLVATVREGKGEASQFAGVIGNVTALAAQLGVGFNEVGAALAAMTRLGTDAETASTQLQRVFTALVKVTPQQAKAFKSVGLDANVLRQELGTKGLLFVLEQVRKAFGNNIPAIEKAFGDIRAFRGVIALVGKQAGATEQIFKDMANTTGSLSTAFGAVSKTTAQQFRDLRSSAEVAGISIGAILAPIAGKAAQALAGAADDVTKFFERLQAAHTVHAKVEVIWQGLEGIGRSLLAAFERIDFSAAGRSLLDQVERLGNFLKGVDFHAVGAEVGTKIRQALERLGDFIAQVDWSKVGKVIVDGLAAAVVFVASALPGILNGLGRLAAKILVGSLQLLGGAAKEIGRGIVKGIEAGFDAAAQGLEELALKVVLKIIEPFTHLPGILGGGAFRDLKDSLQGQLDQMESAAKHTATAIQNALAGVTSTGDVNANDNSSPNRSPGFVRQPSALIPTSPAAKKVAQTAGVQQAAKVATDAATATVAKNFTLPFNLQLAQAKAAATASAADDLNVARQIRAFIERAIPKLNGQKLIDAYNQLGSVNQAIADAVQKAKGFAIPQALQLAQAKATALGKPITGILEKIRAAAEKALKSGRLGFQGQLDAWNAIASVNDQLKSQVTNALGKFKQLDTRKFLSGISGLTPAQVKQLRAGLSQIGPNGTVPEKGVGAFGFKIGAGDIVVQHTTMLDGRPIEKSTTKYQQKRNKRNPPQRRGPHAGLAF